MKIEFKQLQTEQLPLDDLKKEQFIAVAIETFNLLGWFVGNVTDNGLTAYTNNGFFAWNAEVRMNISSGFATLQSKSREDTVTDIIENKKNIQNFISTFMGLKNTSRKEPPVMYGNVEMNVA